MKSSIERRLAVLEGSHGLVCPNCLARSGFSEEELDGRLQALLSGQDIVELPKSSDSCPRCQRHAAMSEREIDNELARLANIMKKAEGYDGSQNPVPELLLAIILKNNVSEEIKL